MNHLHWTYLVASHRIPMLMIMFSDMLSCANYTDNVQWHVMCANFTDHVQWYFIVCHFYRTRPLIFDRVSRVVKHARIWFYRVHFAGFLSALYYVDISCLTVNLWKDRNSLSCQAKKDLTLTAMTSREAVEVMRPRSVLLDSYAVFTNLQIQYVMSGALRAF